MKSLPKKKRFKPSSAVIIVFGVTLLLTLLALALYFDQSQLTSEKTNFNRQQLYPLNESKTINTSATANKELKVHFIDVGQGDCILLEQGLSAMLIDGGTNSNGQAIKSYIDNLNISKLDYVIGTHVHSDNIGGLSYIINSMQVDRVYFPNQTSSSKSFENFVDVVKNKDLQFTLPIVQENLKLGDTTCTILAPNSNNYKNENDYSIVIKVQYGDTSFLFTGDADASSETEMLNKNLNIKADVLKVGHHGSKTSTSDNFLSAISPKYAVISVGKDNDYGYPDQNILNKLKASNIQVYRTDENGTVVATSNGKDIIFNTKPGSYNGKTSMDISEN